MYYNLTRKQYKNYEKKFRRTYIGSVLFIEQIITVIVFMFVACDMIFVGDMLSTILKAAGVEVGITMYTGFAIALIILLGIIIIVNQLSYRKELKQYILTKLEK